MRNKELTNNHTWNAHFKQRVGQLATVLLLLLQLSIFLVLSPSRFPSSFLPQVFSSQTFLSLKWSSPPLSSLLSYPKISSSVTQNISPLSAIEYTPLNPPKTTREYSITRVALPLLLTTNMILPQPLLRQHVAP